MRNRLVGEERSNIREGRAMLIGTSVERYDIDARDSQSECGADRGCGEPALPWLPNRSLTLAPSEEDSPTRRTACLWAGGKSIGSNSKPRTASGPTYPRLGISRRLQRTLRREIVTEIMADLHRGPGKGQIRKRQQVIFRGRSRPHAESTSRFGTGLDTTRRRNGGCSGRTGRPK